MSAATFAAARSKSARQSPLVSRDGYRNPSIPRPLYVAELGLPSEHHWLSAAIARHPELQVGAYRKVWVRATLGLSSNHAKRRQTCQNTPCLARPLPASAAGLFSHVTANKAAFYRAIMDAFAAAKRQFRLHLRPDEVQAEASWPLETPTLEAVQQALAQLID